MTLSLLPLARPGRAARWGGPLLALLLAGCASPDLERARAPVAQAARDTLGVALPPGDDGPGRAARTQALLAEPLSEAAAVELSLLNHPGLQARLEGLGVAEADRVQASRLANPRLERTLRRQSGGGEAEWTLSLGLGHLLTLPWARAEAEGRLADLQQQAVQALLAQAAQARKAWVLAVAAEQSLEQARQVRRAAAAGAELARRTAAAGNFTRLEQLQQERLATEAELGLLAAERERHAARERLQRALGLDGDPEALRLPPHLPALPPAPPVAAAPDTASRLDVQAARAALDRLTPQLDRARAQALLESLELGLERTRARGEPVQNGLALGLELPLFDGGQLAQTRSEARWRQAAQELLQRTREARSQLREAARTAASAHAIAWRYQAEVLPAARRISQENLLRYNGMLIGVFDLLADARAQAAAVQAAQAALSDYWLAAADLDMARLGPPVPAGTPMAPAAAAAAPATDGH